MSMMLHISSTPLGGESEWLERSIWARRGGGGVQRGLSTDTCIGCFDSFDFISLIVSRTTENVPEAK